MKKYGLIGKTLGYSFSKKFFSEYFTNHRIEAVYENVEIDSIEKIKNVFSEDEFVGFNVTIPYKEEIIPYLDELSAEAAEIKAVNVVQIKEGKFIGYNTDAFGFHQSIKPFLTNKHERALILGTGGAAKAVAYVFHSIGIDVIYCSRNPQKENEFPYDSINNHMLNACKVIVNTTPVGTFPNVKETVRFPHHLLTKDHLVIDLIYNPEKTEFLLRAEKNEATILNGYTMLKEQALKAWQIWNE